MAWQQRLVDRDNFPCANIFGYAVAMDDSLVITRRRLKGWFYTAFIVVFILIWLSMMTAGITASACRNDQYEGERKLRFCNASLIASAWMEIFPIERAKGSIIHLERGIALAQTGRGVEARSAFQDAVDNASSVRGSWNQALLERMNEVSSSRVHEIWEQVRILNY